MVNIRRRETVILDGEEVEVYRIENDVNGNPRFVCHFSTLGVKLKDYQESNIKGLKKYRANWFGGGYVFQSYNIQEDLEFYNKTIKEFYN